MSIERGVFIYLLIYCINYNGCDFFVVYNFLFVNVFCISEPLYKATKNNIIIQNVGKNRINIYQLTVLQVCSDLLLGQIYIDRCLNIPTIYTQTDLYSFTLYISGRRRGKGNLVT